MEPKVEALLAELRLGQRIPNRDEWRAILEAHAAWLSVRGGVRARLDGARLDGASLVGARLDGASLVGARLHGARLHGASLDRASLVGARLDRARLDGARLHGARLDGASLHGARLDGASLVGARLHGARLHGASLHGARLGNITIPAGARLLQVGPIGSRHATTTGVLVPGAVVGVATGCFSGTVDEFRAAVKSTHGDPLCAASAKHMRDYAALLTFFEALAMNIDTARRDEADGM